MSTFLKFILSVMLVFSAGISQALATRPTSQEVTTIWPTIPFYALGDIGQYEKTMSKDREQTRKMYWDELMGAVVKMANNGAWPESVLEPLFNIMMMFEQAYDFNKAQDVINIDKSLEAMFRASFDDLFRIHDVREDRRKVEFAYGAEITAIKNSVQNTASQQPLGKPLSAEQVNQKLARHIFEQIDVVAYGTFSNLGRGQFQVTLHLTGHQNGVTRSFVAVGALTEAIQSLAQQVFDFFQKNIYPDWETPEKQLQWLPMPRNPNKMDGYTWSEAQQYCRARGYRLPYSRELMLAESGGAYKEGGIPALQFKRPYSVADKRSVNENYVLTPGHEDATGGPVQGASYSMSKGLFWCVKGKVSAEVQIFETVWELIRKHRSDREIYLALETVRFEIADFDSNSDIFWGPHLTLLPRMGSLQEALDYLNSRGIRLSIPSSF